MSRFYASVRFFIGIWSVWRWLFFSLNIAVLSVGALHAQEFHGRIMANDSAGVPYATIYLPALRMGAITDQQGYYRINSLPAGAYRVEFSSVGHQSVSDTLVLGVEEDLEYSVRLPEIVYTLNEVFVMPDGSDYALEVIRKVQENAPAYYGRVLSYEAEVIERHDQNVKDMQNIIRRAKKVFAIIPMMRRYFDLMLKYPDLAYRTSKIITYDGQRTVNSHCRLIECNKRLSDKEQELIVPRDGWTPGLFGEIHSRYLPWREGKMKKYEFEWIGSYREGDRTIEVIEFIPRKGKYKPKGRVHVITGLWCVLKVEYPTSAGGKRIECQEVFPDLYLPVSVLSQHKLEVPADSVPDVNGMNCFLLTGSAIRYIDISIQE